MNLNIDNFEINENSKVYIIAEIGINHNGDIEIAKDLIKVAKNAGCNAVKFQKRTPELAVPEAQWNEMKETPWGSLTYLDYKKKIEFNIEQYKLLLDFSKKNNITIFDSCWDELSVEIMNELSLPAFKLASASLTDKKTIDAMIKTSRPIIISTGMSTENEIDKTVDYLDDYEFAILHSTSSYPCNIEELNLNMIKTLKQKYPQKIIGYSGHEVGIPTTVAAVALGAKIIERHITLDRTMWGTDQAASIEPHGLGILVNHIRAVENSLGTGVKKVYDSEFSPRSKLRKYKSLN